MPRRPRPGPFLVALGDTIRELRTEQGLSQEEVSLRCGVHRNYIGGVERAERQPSALTVVKLADALGVKPSELLRRTEAMTCDLR